MSPCEWLKGPNGEIIHVKTSRQRGAKKRCRFCTQEYRANEGKLCDFPVGNGKTCDAEMCSGCSRTIGRQETDIGHGMKKMNDTVDVCPIHRSQAAVRDGKLVIDESSS